MLAETPLLFVANCKQYYSFPSKIVFFITSFQSETDYALTEKLVIFVTLKILSIIKQNVKKIEGCEYFCIVRYVEFICS